MSRRNGAISMILTVFMLSAGTATRGQQISDSVYWVSFTDKQNIEYRIDQPQEFLSQRSVNRRAWQGLGVDAYDLPVTPSYLEEIRQMGVRIRHVSNWLNGFAMITTDSSLFEAVLEKPFTDTIAWEPDTDEVYIPPKPSGERFEPPAEQPPGFAYGVAAEQVTMLNMQILHEMGYTGRGVWIGVLDGGFRNVDSLPSFYSMLQEERLLGTRNYVNDLHVFRESSVHGMYVLSIMAGEWDQNLVGTAPHASYLLCMTENPRYETRIEEIKTVYAKCGSLEEEAKVEGSSMVLMTLEDGALANLWSSFQVPSPSFPRAQFSTRIIGEKGLIDLDAYGELRVAIGGEWRLVESQEPIDWQGKGFLDPVRLESYARQCQEFIDAVRNQEPPSVTAWDGRQAVAAALAAYASSASGKEVVLST